MAMATVNSAPMVDDDIGAEGADNADHVFEDLVAPDFLRFRGGLGVAKILGAREVELHPIAACGGEQFLGSNQAELGRLLGPERVLTAFPASEREKSDVCVQTACQVGQNRGTFIVRMGRDVENSRGHASRVNGFNGFGKSGACPRSGRKLRGPLRCSHNDYKRQTRHTKKPAHVTSRERTETRSLKIEIGRSKSTTLTIHELMRKAIVAFHASRSGMRARPAQSLAIPIFAWDPFAKRAKPRRPSSAEQARDRTTS